MSTTEADDALLAGPCCHCDRDPAVAASIGIMSSPAPWRIAARSCGAPSKRAGGSGARGWSDPSAADRTGQLDHHEQRDGAKQAESHALVSHDIQQ